jgi:hypothetical protein
MYRNLMLARDARKRPSQTSLANVPRKRPSQTSLANVPRKRPSHLQINFPVRPIRRQVSSKNIFTYSTSGYSCVTTTPTDFKQNLPHEVGITSPYGRQFFRAILTNDVQARHRHFYIILLRTRFVIRRRV